MRGGRLAAAAAIVGLLASCGGGGGGSSGGPVVVAPTPTPVATPTPTASTGCTLRERQDWVLAQMREWYLFPETLPAAPNFATSTIDDFIDGLTATARSQRKDRFFTYLTSIKEENAYYNSGATAGIGVRFALATGNRLVITEAFEGAPALAAGIDRGTEITAIGTTSANLETVSAIIARGGTDALIDALGPDTVGTTRVFRITNAAGTKEVSVAKADFALQPVSTRYGAKIIEDGGRKYGYVNLRTFINTADDQLRNAFGQFKAAGITEVIVDLRYNGGGLLSTSEVLANLLGGNRATTDVYTKIAFRPEKAAENETINFARETNAIASTKIAFIGRGGTASASESVINAFVPFLGSNAGLIGTNTYGKPVGQIALDRAACDDRLRVIAFALQNAAGNGAYYDGLAAFVQASCQAGDDIAYQLGDAREASTRSALDYLQGKSCTRITAGVQSTMSASTGRTIGAATGAELLTTSRPSTAQREVPGLF